ncbi:MAG: hypothetical protein K9J16_00290 [Melioribacteraceae bacterium]|nr:hypothetical protein [Melioribacteraceae bacterium]MCF8355026.1 hypothetical protein [Melioribacteraceae bacterium]MCF8392705.1 hypothetical protein [Melioribacteraceae bacterium]MCF8417727.1 hypothetical protein [Melioribacteraceae bacterium]
MDIDDLLNQASDPNNLPGVYNYCDRWCERCPFTDRCLNYTMSEEMINKADDDPLAAVKDALTLASELIKKIAKEEGIDIDEITAEDDDSDDNNFEEEIENKPLSREAMKYIHVAGEWLKNNYGSLQRRGKELIKNYEMGIDDSNPDETADKLKDALENIQWYLYFIKVKIARAYFTQEDSLIDDDEEFTFEQVNTAAKLALIGCNRSIKAWEYLLSEIEEEEDNFIDILLVITRVRNMLNDEFPEAKNFKRPYFD